MSKRDYINEILAKKQRSFNEWHTGSFKLSELEWSFENLQKKREVNNFHLSLYLVGIVTCLEMVTRQAVQRLVDHGSPFVERIEKFKDYLKFDLTVATALHDKKVSFGELVSHLIPINNLENIASHLGVLLDGNLSHFLRNLKYFVEPDMSQYFDNDECASEDAVEDEKVEEPELILDDVDPVMASISKLFEMRHVIVHEANFNLLDSEAALIEFFKNATRFSASPEELLEQTLNPELPRSAMLLAAHQSNEADKLGAEIKSLYEELYELLSGEEKPIGGNEKSALEISQKAFEDYLAAEVSLEDILVSPASGYMLGGIYARISKDIYIQRIKRLKEIKEFYT